MGDLEDHYMSLDILNIGKSKEKAAAARTRRDLETESERFYTRLTQQPQPNSASFLAGMQSAIQQSGLQGVSQGFGALPGQFYGDAYQQNMESAINSQGNVQALGAARMGTRGGQGRGGASFSGAPEGIRRAQEGVAGGTQGAIAQSRVQQEQGRVGLATTALQGQAGISSQIAQLLAGGQQTAFQGQGMDYRAMLQAISGMGASKMGNLTDIGKASIGSQGGLNETDLIALAALFFL